MKLTVIFANIGAAANIGGPVDYRRVTIDLTPEQEKALALVDEKWESRGPIFIEDEKSTPEAKEK